MQKLGLASLLITINLLFMLAFPAAATGPKAPVPAAVPAAAAPAPAPAQHPHIIAALEQMRGAKGHLDQAEGEFAGHRARAIDLLNQAIHEAEICRDAPK
jgi:outer membrane protein TolC